MSSGAPFILISNVGVQDQLLTAFDLLKKRINKHIVDKNPIYTEEHMALLPKDGYLKIQNSVLPSLNEIEKTHTTFVNNTYKPCIPVAFEYIKAGYANPQFGQKITYILPQIGQFTNDMVVHIRIKGLRAKDPRDRARYVALLGHKLFEQVKLTVDFDSIIDEYGSDEYTVYYNRELKPEKKIGWLRGIGQEIPHLGYITSDPSFDVHREYRWIGSGNQTLKYNHDAIDLFIPLLFWCRDVRNSLPNHLLPWGRTQVQIKLAEITDIVGFADYGGGGLYHEPTIEICDLYTNQIFTAPEIFQIYKKKFQFGIIRVHKKHREQININYGQTYEVLLNNLKLPIESLDFFFRPRENLSLSQYWYKSCRLVEKTMKVPVVAKNTNLVIIGSITSAQFGTTAANPSANVYATALITSGSALSNVDNTYQSYDFVLTGGTGFNSMDITLNRYTIGSYNGTTKEVTLTANWTGLLPDVTTTYELFTPQLAINVISYYEEYPVIDTVSLEINGAAVFKSNSEAFYNNYLPQRYGTNLSTPEDRGIYSMPFCLYPGNHNPSGSINFSLCREAYLSFKSNVNLSQYPIDLVVSARAINFILTDKGTMMLKYIS